MGCMLIAVARGGNSPATPKSGAAAALSCQCYRSLKGECRRRSAGQGNVQLVLPHEETNKRRTPSEGTLDPTKLDLLPADGSTLFPACVSFSYTYWRNSNALPSQSFTRASRTGICGGRASLIARKSPPALRTSATADSRSSTLRFNPA